MTEISVGVIICPDFCDPRSDVYKYRPWFPQCKVGVTRILTPGFMELTSCLVRKRLYK